MKTFFISIGKGTVLAIVAAIFFITGQPLFMIGSDTASELIAPRLYVQILALAICAVALWLPVRASLRSALIVLAALAVLLGGHRLLIDNLHHRLADVYLGVPVQVLALDPESETGLAAHRVTLGFWIGPKDSSRHLFILSPTGIGLNRDNVNRWTT